MKKHILLFALAILTITNVTSQNKEITKKEKKVVLKLISENLLESYINLDLAKQMSSAIKLNSKKYSSISNPIEFSEILTADLQSVSKDLHLNVRFEPKRIAQSKRLMSDEMELEMEKKMAMKMAEVNFGFTETKILDGNIGYLNLRMFADIKYAEEAATAAMNFLRNTNALIIDLRTNGGGDPSIMQFLSSYFFDETPVLLSDFYERKTNTKTQLFTLAQVQGTRYTNKPVYILTSSNTFSAAEAFTYILKYLDKAIVVGEVTKGGANRTKRINLNDDFTISVPYIESIHPITKTNWEGKGVQPDIKTFEKDAFITAYIEAINKTVERNKNKVLNKIGYTFLQDKSVENAIIVFQENTRLYPKEANTWDSLGEAYFTNRDKANALKSYTKALELNPNSESAKAMIQKLKNIN